MELLSNFDIILVVVVAFFSIIGLIRGFLKELTSIITWFGSIYLTSILKPFAIKLLSSRIQFPFLLDLIANASVFVVLIIFFSICSKTIVEKIKSLLPYSINTSLGFLFGFVKGIMIIGLFLGCFNSLFKEESKKPEILKTSFVNDLLINKTNIFIDTTNVLLGSYVGSDQVKSNVDNLNDFIDKTERYNKVRKILNEDTEDNKKDKNKEKDINDIIDDSEKKKDINSIIDGLF